MINLRKMNKDDYYKIYKWCQNKDVYEWFEQRKLSYNEIEDKYKNKLKDKKQDLYIITYNNTDIGLVQIYKYKDNLDILKEYNNIYEYDIFIGENNYLNKGIGKYIVEYINNFIYTKYKANYIILRPFKRNIRAIKCYKKCNFIEIYNYIDKNTIGNIEDIVVLLNKKENNMRTIVSQVYIKKENKILMVQENKEGIKGKWNMPAGKLEDNESVIDTAIRETKEETNIDVKIKGLIAIQQNTSSFGQLIILYFLGEYISGDISFDNKEISDVKWMTEEEIKALENIRGKETIDDILELAKKRTIPLDRIKIENMI